jgi:hypothetical protein
LTQRYQSWCDLDDAAPRLRGAEAASDARSNGGVFDAVAK